MSQKKAQFFVGIDVAADTFMACAIRSPEEIVLQPTEFENTPSGIEAFSEWLQTQGLLPSNTVLCMESTGVYGEHLAYLLTSQEWWLAVQPPLEVKRAFAPIGHKNDAVDSRQIAEYAARYPDHLHRWQPKKALLEQVQVLLRLREQLLRQRTASKNALKSMQRKVIRTPLAEEIHEENIRRLTHDIKRIEEEIRNLFKQDPHLHQTLLLLIGTSGVGLLLASYTLLLMETLRDPYNPKVMAAYIGIAPYQHRSGSSVYRTPASRRFGPATMRKLLRLAALSLRMHNGQFRRYYERKIAEGKPSAVVLNNMENKLLRIMCAVVRDQTPFISNYRSLPPSLKSAS